MGYKSDQSLPVVAAAVPLVGCGYARTGSHFHELVATLPQVLHGDRPRPHNTEALVA